ncbi:hypothetical protein [Tropicimonas sp. IMCC34011]|uniref:hypothetical protein n=1 Tax=Tropicimonas sp. IMCC34011 TaxID=2248759 RepID=UPI000E2339EA|nr:hypothetical protein [Tropicimonas sp. IMCC34011]
MMNTDRRPEHLGWIEVALQAAHPDLPNLGIAGQVHYGPPDHFAFIHVFGVDGDRARRRQVRAEASALLRCLGYAVAIEPGRDVFDVSPDRPVSAHDRLGMLRCLHAAYGLGG